MLKKAIFLCLLSVIALINSIAAKGDGNPKETHITMVTTEGIIKLKLYNDTPLHRDNFIKLVKDHFYDSTIFHRVINEFMIQGGDPTSKKAGPEVMLGNGENGYTIPAEIMPTKHFHKKGVLAAARMGDDVNPSKASSGCQFYIVQGKKYTSDELNTMEQRMLNGQKQQAFMAIMSKPENLNLKMKFTEFQRMQLTDSLVALSKTIEPLVMAEVEKMKPQTKLTEEQRNAYMTVGGTPHLDGGYTVYGEVTEGLDVVDRIAATKTMQGDRPEKDIRILKVTIDK
jgi:peptidylprolyl isomerase